jgi:hypothetical protein
MFVAAQPSLEELDAIEQLAGEQRTGEVEAEIVPKAHRTVDPKSGVAPELPSIRVLVRNIVEETQRDEAAHQLGMHACLPRQSTELECPCTLVSHDQRGAAGARDGTHRLARGSNFETSASSLNAFRSARLSFSGTTILTVAYRSPL